MWEWGKALTTALLFLCCAVSLTQSAHASKPSMPSKETRELDREARRLDGAANTPAGEQQVLEQMSQQLHVPVATLQQQKQSSGLSFGNLFIANALAQRTGQSFDQILDARRSGKGWGQIANENNVRLGDVVSQMKRSSKAVERAENQRREEARAARQRDRDNGRGPMMDRGGMMQPGRGAGAGQGRGRR